MIDTVTTTTTSATWPVLDGGPTVAQLEMIVQECRRAGVPMSTRLQIEVLNHQVSGIRLHLVTDDHAVEEP